MDRFDEMLQKNRSIITHQKGHSMLQFILGNSGAGKSHYLYEKIIQESMKHPEINYLVIVPEQFTMQTQQDLCMTAPESRDHEYRCFKFWTNGTPHF